MTNLFPSAQTILDDFKEKHPMLDDRTASIFISTALRALAKDHLRTWGEDSMSIEKDILVIAEELERLK